MNIIDQIEELVTTMYRRGEEIGPFVVLGPKVYEEIYKHMLSNSFNPYGKLGAQTLTIRTSLAHLEIKCDKYKSADYIGIEGRTLLDIIVEQELLGL